MQLRKLVAEWLREAMAAQEPRVTGVALADRSGLSRPAISDILNEKVDAEDATLETLARALDYPLPEIGRSMRERIGDQFSYPGGPGGDVASSGLDLFEELLADAAAFTRRLDAMQTGVGKGPLCVFLDEAEKAAREKHPEYGAFIRATWAELRRRYGCSGGERSPAAPAG